MKCSKFSFDPLVRIMKSKTKVIGIEFPLKVMAEQRKQQTDNPQNATNICKKDTHEEFISKTHKQLMYLNIQGKTPIK